MTAQDVITKARVTLSDQSSTRYTDADLISHLNDAVRDFQSETSLDKEVFYIELDAALTTYDMSATLLTITRVEYEGLPLPLLSHSRMDGLNSGWQLESGLDVQSIVYDKLSRSKFRIYPSITDADLITDSNSDYGILISFDLSYLPSYKNLEDLPLVNKFLSVYGVAKPATITAVGDTIEISDQWEKALAHFVVGQALRTDQDTQNKTIGNEELLLYGQIVQAIKSKQSTDFTTGDLTTEYR